LNHLAHFKVSFGDAGLITGGLLGDFVKGRLTAQYAPEIERGIRLHRAVDAFTDRHRITRQSARRFAPEYRRFAPIMLDIIFDHFLARQWRDWHDERLDEFADAVFDAIETQADALPAAARQTAQRMRANRSLEHSAEEVFIDRALCRIAARLSRENPLDQAFCEFKRLEGELMRDFALFFPELLEYCRRWRQEH